MEESSGQEGDKVSAEASGSSPSMAFSTARQAQSLPTSSRLLAVPEKRAIKRKKRAIKKIEKEKQEAKEEIEEATETHAEDEHDHNHEETKSLPINRRHKSPPSPRTQKKENKRHTDEVEEEETENEKTKSNAAAKDDKDNDASATPIEEMKKDAKEGLPEKEKRKIRKTVLARELMTGKTTPHHSSMWLLSKSPRKRMLEILLWA